MTLNNSPAVLSLPGPHNITRHQLENGMVVLVYENPSVQSVFIAGSLYGGGMFEDPAYNGLANMTAAALMRGTHNRDFYRIHAELEDIGADLGVSAGQHNVSFNGKALAEDLPTLVDVLADVLRYPSFPMAQVERLRGETLTWLRYQQQDTRRLATRAFRENLYAPEHPYHYGLRGTLETVAALPLALLADFHTRIYGPHGMIIAIVGAIRAEEAIALVEQRFGDWHNPQQPTALEVPPAGTPHALRRVHVPVPGKTQTDVVLGVVGPSRFAPDYQAVNMVNSILGQFGMMGRIGSVVREQSGMAYYAGSRIEGGYGPGAWLISMGVNPVNVAAAVELALQEVRRIAAERVDDTDIEDNKSYFTGRLPLQLESSEGIAGTLLAMESYQLGLDYLLRFPSIINALTKEDLQAAVQQYWTPDALVIASSGPALQPNGTGDERH